eukprot:CAMPEP_0179491276 /NCGR_PEP_ID=MMETSP0799-20121207/65988_1 /TAXON_ID=46947 /ORGANISM="Geminigera cryophila, Strain CCMP2564" /LENGTH=42 /DNA_ID= /DNA_START= /DNA_END= /DNA_ORIENTATION=
MDMGDTNSKFKQCPRQKSSFSPHLTFTHAYTSDMLVLIHASV